MSSMTSQSSPSHSIARKPIPRRDSASSSNTGPSPSSSLRQPNPALPTVSAIGSTTQDLADRAVEPQAQPLPSLPALPETGPLLGQAPNPRWSSPPTMPSATASDSSQFPARTTSLYLGKPALPESADKSEPEPRPTVSMATELPASPVELAHLGPTEKTKGPAKLRKEIPQSQPSVRSDNSDVQRDLAAPDVPVQERGGRLVSPRHPRVRSSSAQPLQSRESSNAPRFVSQPLKTNAAPPLSIAQPPASPEPPKKVEKLRRTLLPGVGSKANSHGRTPARSDAWILTPDESGPEYNTELLVKAEKVPEIWNEEANMYVCLYPPESGYGPSFKLAASLIASSLILTELVQPLDPRAKSRDQDRFAFSRSRSVSPHSGPEEFILYIPPPLPSAVSDSASTIPIERLLAVRNMFAFLTGQPLVATQGYPTPFAVFMQIATLLDEFSFTGPDGSSYGPEVDMSFSFLAHQLNCADVRNSREKTLEALVLAERMRSNDLYGEAFVHAVGKYSALVELNSPLFEKVSSYTRQRLGRAQLDLLNRQHTVNVRLEQFDFPSIFVGVANSTSLTEFRSVRFKQWKNAFTKMRAFTLSYYKTLYGSWPPKASNKKNPFTESGLNRLVLKALYSDMCALYDLLVDRKSLTPRVIDQGFTNAESDDDDKSKSKDKDAEKDKDKKPRGNPMISGLRRMLSEFDNSSPPVLPPIPFDVPTLPTMTSILETYDKLPPKEQARFDRKIKSHELKLILEKSYDYHTNSANQSHPFLAEFKEFEAKEARGKPAADLADQRIGYWLFLYVVIQSLPILAMDAPNLMYTDNVEYFLCQPPMGNPPWTDEGTRKIWYGVSGGNQYVELPADSVLFSVEAIYHRSHCWQSAQIWEADMQRVELQAQGMMPPDPVPNPYARPSSRLNSVSRTGTPSTLSIETSPSPAAGMSPVLLPRNRSPGPRQLPSMRGGSGANPAHRSSIAFGIEPIWDIPDSLLPPGDRNSRVASYDRLSVLGPSPLGDLNKSRSASVGNLAALSQAHGSGASGSGGSGSESPTVAGNPGATFDDILGKTEGKKEKKRKSFFFA